MRITFGHMGTSAMVFEDLLQKLGHDVVPPLKPSKKTLTLGVQHAPEFACIPFKIVLGTYLEVMDRGVDTIISAGGRGPCRAGYYGDLHRRILESLGYEVDFIFFYPPLKYPGDFLRKLSRLKGKNSWRTFGCHFRAAWDKLMALDDLEQRAHQVRPRELRRGTTSRALARGLEYLRQASSREEIREARFAALAEVEGVPHDPGRKALQVGIIGEIYVQLEPFANFDVEETLGHMGAEVRRSIFVTRFAREDVFAHGSKSIPELAAPYLDYKIGGHGQNSVGEVVQMARHGYAGVVQLAPFTCIPEIVAKSIMPRLSRELDIPVLTVFIDEQTGKAGVETRLEAFMDLLWQKQERRDKKVI
jgi:predicted nucleotide-binding protein (sugar kinase/HSP70/actin superfamily)